MFFKRKSKIKAQIISLFEYNPKEYYRLSEIAPILGQRKEDIYEILTNDDDFFFDSDIGEKIGWRLSKYKDAIFLDSIENMPKNIDVGKKVVYKGLIRIVKKQGNVINLDLLN